MHLTSEDKIVLDEFDQSWGKYLETIRKGQQFKLGDFLILKVKERWETQLNVKTNSYGAPLKYKVVHVNDHNIAFVKRVNKNGEPIGRLSSCVGLKSDEYFKDNLTFEFELDPDFADAIILQDDYDPTSLHRSKKDIWKAVTEHNKAHKIPTTELSDVVKLFASVSIGDTLYTSNIGTYFIEDKKVVNPTTWNTSCRWNQRTAIKGPAVTILTLRDKNGKVKEVPPDALQWKALYRERPRTYRELNI